MVPTITASQEFLVVWLSNIFRHSSVIQLQTFSILDNLPFYSHRLLKCVLESLFWHLDFFCSECPLHQLQYKICWPVTCPDFWFGNRVTVLLESVHGTRPTDLNVLKPTFQKWHVWLHLMLLSFTIITSNMTRSLSPKVPVTSTLPICSSLLVRIKSRVAAPFLCPFLLRKRGCQSWASGSSIGMNPRDVFVVIHMPGRKEFDVSFRSAEKLDLFWTLYQEEKDQATGRSWGDWVD